MTAKPDPKPNLIRREGKKQTQDLDGYALWIALIAAADLIATMSGGDSDLRKAYEEVIK